METDKEKVDYWCDIADDRLSRLHEYEKIISDLREETKALTRRNTVLEMAMDALVHTWVKGFKK